MTMVVLAATWKQISYNFLFFLAGLAAIPRSVIEARRSTARGRCALLDHRVPLLSPTTFFLLVVNIVYAFFDTFGIIDAMTGGGPAKATETLVYKVYADGRLGGDLGGSAAQSVILMIIVIALTAIQFRYVEKKGDLLMPSVMWKELTAEDLRAKAAANAIVVLPGGLDGAARAASPGRRRYLPVRGRLQGGAELAVKDVPVVVAPTLWCGMAEHHMAFGGTFTFDIPTYRACCSHSSRASSATASSACSSSTATAATSRRSIPSCRTLRARRSLKLYATTYFELSEGGPRAVPRRPESVHHACEVETSMMMVVAPDTVKHERLREPFGHAQRRSAQGISGVALPDVQGHHRERRRWRCAPRQRRQGQKSCSTCAPRARRDAEEPRDVA
jgi:hypothetical protein